jgi:hypothetical protein
VVGDEYIRITVFLAAVLFLVGIGSTFKLPTVRYVLICVGAVLLILATVLIAHQPGIPPNHHLAADRTRAIRDGCRAAFGGLPTRQVVDRRLASPSGGAGDRCCPLERVSSSPAVPLACHLQQS